LHLKKAVKVVHCIREALFGLHYIVDNASDGGQSDFLKTLDNIMCAQPEDWNKYYTGSETELIYKCKFSYSDRWRYYANNQALIEAIEHLFSKFNHLTTAMPLVSQFLPEQYKHMREGRINWDAEALVKDKVKEILEKYYSAAN